MADDAILPLQDRDFRPRTHAEAEKTRARVVDDADRRWAEENALLLEALAGGAEEAKR